MRMSDWSSVVCSSDLVLEQVVAVAGGDEALDTVDMPGAVGLLDGFGAAGADVRSGVGLGEHHGGSPVALDDERAPVPLLLIADAVEDVGHLRPGLVQDRKSTRLNSSH